MGGEGRKERGGEGGKGGKGGVKRGGEKRGGEGRGEEGEGREKRNMTHCIQNLKRWCMLPKTSAILLYLKMSSKKILQLLRTEFN